MRETGRDVALRWVFEGADRRRTQVGDWTRISHRGSWLISRVMLPFGATDDLLGNRVEVRPDPDYHDDNSAKAETIPHGDLLRCTGAEPQSIIRLL